MLKQYRFANNVIVPTETDDANLHVYTNPDADERQVLVRTLNLDNHSLSSALDPDEISRVEFHADHVFIVWKRPTSSTFRAFVLFNVVSMGMVLANGRLVVIAAEDMSFGDEKHPRVGGRGFYTQRNRQPCAGDVIIRYRSRVVQTGML